MNDSPSHFRVTYRRLVAYTLNYWNIFLMAIAGMILVALSQPGFAALMEPMLDGSFVDKNPDTIKWVPFAIVAVFLVRALGGFISDYGMSWVGRMVIKDLRDEMFNKLMLLPGDYYDKNSTGNTISKFTYDVEQVAQAATNAITIMIRDVLMVISLIGYMFFISPLLAALFLLIGPFIAFLISLVSRRFRKVSQRIQQSMGKVTHVVEEAIQAQRVVKIFGGQEYEKNQFSSSNESNRKQNMRLVATTSISTPIIQVIVAFALAGIIYMATMEGIKNSITVGAFVAFITAMMMLFAPVKRLTNVNAILQKGIAAADSIFNLLDTQAEHDDGEYKTNRVAGNIEFKNINFRYASNPDKYVLKSINLNIRAGQTIAFVGRSGSGKSTLVNLLPRLYDSYEGEIQIDGQDIRHYTLDSLRNQIAYVGQEIVLFNDTVEHNIAYGSLHDYSEQDVITAAKSAHAYEFIEQMIHGMQTIVGEKGVLLSGGQRQRIAIARALLKNAPILILDEATSALDTESERHIQSALEELIKNRTTLVIAHRLSTIENADLIVVMDDGNIVETGSHKELLAQGGHYSSLHQMQFSDAG
ncbi:MAG: lipid A export permease/ATP-binding protein MsbA [Gammaproteobacteria bacterium]|nr:lipid A export permease/ATP-binding protein MsbA [Gammaproteobacteria bacterium]MCW8911428.1 lipid A export permease/ATP-binding protein MsbA [Gammaproteobacteria bacterium]MCW9055709.1 lipid A export permease/ATP-binding protein MsbA [Gammaproteobacteria bacterium]